MSAQNHALSIRDALAAQLPTTFKVIPDQREDHLKLFIQPIGRRLPKFYVEIWDDQIITMEVSGSPHGHNVTSLNRGPFTASDVEGLIAYFRDWLARNLRD